MAMTFLFVSVFLSVRPLVQYRYCVKTTFHIIKLFPPSSFWAQLRPALQNSKVNSLSWGAKCIWGIMGFWKDTLFDRNTRIRHEIDPQLLLISKEVIGTWSIHVSSDNNERSLKSGCDRPIFLDSLRMYARTVWQHGSPVTWGGCQPRT